MSADVAATLAGHVRAHLEYREFDTGSKGFRCQGEVAIGGKRYQASAQAILIGSKQDPALRPQASADEVKAALADLVSAGVPAKAFSSGKTGYYTSGKLHLGSESYQAQAQAVLLAAQ